MSTLSSRIRGRVTRPVRPLVDAALRTVANHLIDRAKIDPRITYPSYKSFDELVDIERLKSLDVYISERVKEHIRTRRDEFFNTGVATLERKSPQRPGSRIIYLSKSDAPFRYINADKPGLWRRSEDAREFEPLMDFISTLPFKATARMMIMYDDTGKAVTAHRDHVDSNACIEFLWFRTNLNKPFYMLNHKTGVKKYVESYTTWFDTVNQYHGADEYPGLSISLRVDGVFSDELRKQIPVPPYNAASTPSLWACTSR